MESTNVGSEKLMRDLKNIAGDGEALVKAAAGDAREAVTGMRTRTEESLRQVRATVGDLRNDVAARARAAAQTTSTYVHDRPWQSIGLAAGAGLIIGLLINRRRNRVRD
jgi:ElaB/YqjD/DUF883 family membrane-anchored ribosome-binding protein